MATLSGITLFIFKSTMKDSTNLSAEIARKNLLDQIKLRAELMAKFLSEDLVNPLYVYDMESVSDICNIAGEQKDVIQVLVFDKEGHIIYYNTRSKPLLNVKIDDVSAKTLKSRNLEILSTETLMIAAAPIMIHDQLLGGVKAEFSLDSIFKDINKTNNQLQAISVKGVEQTIFYVFIITGVLSALGITLSIFVARSMSRPIKQLSKFAHVIGNGKFEIDIPINRSDEIGELADSFKIMSGNLKQTTVSKEYLDNIVKNIIDTLIIVTPKSIIKTVNGATCDLLGFNKEELIGKSVAKIIKDDENHIFDETGLVDLVHRGFLKNIEINYVAKDKNIIPMLFSASVLFNKTEKSYEIVCVAKDITEQKKIKEQIEKSLREKEVLLQEVYHRTKNNMQIISSLLTLQSNHIEDEYYVNIFNDSQNRIRSMSLVHEKLYQSRDLSRIDFNEYVGSLTVSLLRAYRTGKGRIDLRKEIADCTFNIETAITCGLVINELVSNSLKYAFPNNRDGDLFVSLQLLDNNKYKLIVKDNGIGMPEDINYLQAKTLGLQLVNSLTKQLDGAIKLNRNNGTEFSITFRELEYKKRI